MTKLGKFVFTVILLAMLAFGISRWWPKLNPNHAAPNSTPAGDSAASNVKTVATETQVPRLAPPAPYTPKDNILDIEISEYAGYAGLIAANGGLEPNDNSLFQQKYGFKVRLKVSEEESWSALNAGKMAASATTVDVLAVYGKQFGVTVPAQIGFSRGADGIVVRSELKRINDLKGKILAASQFTEAEFFIRYLAQEAGLAVATLPDLNTAPEPDKLNLVFCKDAFEAGDLFLEHVKSGAKLAGCVTWEPKTSEVAAQSGGKASILTTNRNLLIIADILVVNRGFAQQQPKMVEGLVAGLLEGNHMVRDDPAPHLDLIGRAFKWDREKTRAELAKVHLANLPENLAFFSGAIDAAGSFGGIYQSAVYAYGTSFIQNPVDSEKFVNLTALHAIEQSGAFKDQKVAIAPIRSPGAPVVESDPLLSKNIRFLFQPNSAVLDLNNPSNQSSLDDIRRLLQVSPGSTILLRGHVDRSRVEEFRKQGGESYVRTMALRAVEFSKQRAAEIKRLLEQQKKIDPARIDIVGRGWEEPLGGNHDDDRRVEAQWFTLE